MNDFTKDKFTNLMRMDAYYYGFDPTGVKEIDELLSCIACAGKAFHHTSNWRDEAHTNSGHCIGESPVDWIQNAANRAAESILKERTRT